MDIIRCIAQIEQLQKEQDALYHQAALRFGLSDSALWVLYMLSDAEQPCTQQELCRQSYFPKQTVHTTLANLVKNGYAQLQPIPGTRNQKSILLTPKGRALIRETVEPIQQAERLAYGSLSAEKLQAYLDACTHITAALREEFRHLPEKKA